ncbi:MAG TPA: ABC transporter permease [Actinomycetota bacterium]|nr:ABC transporter permease [Actinomycetota bacterium]
MFRREWRQQLLVLLLLTVAVAAAIFSVSAAYNVVPSADARFGTANHRLDLDGSDPRRLDADIAAVTAWFGTVEVIGRRAVPVPGSVETVELRAQDPHGVYGAPMLRLRAGRYPAAAGEVAVTDAVAATFQVGVGGTLALGGPAWVVVGLVENPGDLDDEFALVSGWHRERPESVTILVRASHGRATALPGAVGGRLEARPACHAGLLCLTPGQSEKAAAAAGVLVLATVVLLLVALIAAAGFVVVAQRRLRQLGMLAAIGATQRHLRLVLLANGATVGAIAAVAGTAIALLGWVALAPRLEAAAGHRVDRFDLPWWLIGTGMLLAVVTATAAAWWPARAVARLPVTLALSARPPRPKPARRSAVAAGVLVVIGVVGLAVGIDPIRDQANPLLIIPGTVAIVLAIPLASPLAIRLLAAAAARSPLAARLALRDLARYQARSGAALAAISLALGMAVAAVIAAAAAEHTAGEGNLSDRQLLFRIGDAEPLIPERTPAELARLRSEVDRVAATLDHPAVLALDAAVNPTDREGRGGRVLRPAVVLARQIGANTYRGIGVLYVATPELLGHLGLDRDPVDPDTDVLTPHAGDLHFVNLSNPSKAAPSVQTIDLPAYSSAPTSLITTNGLRREGWQPARAGWLVEARNPPTSAQLAQARQVAADAGMTVETRDNQTELTAIRSGATAAGMLLALGILAMTVGLIRSEAAGDLRTLTATGATSTTRRNLTAATGAALALLGALLGTIGAYLALLAGYHNDLGALSRVPVGHLAVTLVGLPLTAAVVGWLLAGREPPTIARQLLE